MPNKYKCVQINLEENIYNFLKEYIDSVLPGKTDVSYFCKCLMINRLISLGLLHETGEINEYFLPPKLNLDNFDITSGVSLTTLRDISKGE